MSQIKKQGRKWERLKNNISTLTVLMMIVLGWQISNKLLYWHVEVFFQTLDFG